MSSKFPRRLTAIDLQDWLQQANPPMVIDVREPAELELAHLPFKVLHMPLSQSSSWISSLSGLLTKRHPVVVVCHAGIRSWHFGCWLLAQDWGVEVWNLEGGIDSWSTNVDPLVPRY